MTAISLGEIKQDWNSVYSGISHRADIPDSVRFEPFAVVDDDVEIGENCLIGAFTHIRNGTKIGDNTVIGGNNIIEGRCTIGNNVRIQTHNCITYESTIEDKVFISGHFTGGNDRRISWGRDIDHTLQGYTIKYGARIGVAVTLLPGITVGREAMIGAGSVVTRDVPDFELWYGVPCRKHGIVPESERL